MSIKKHGLSIGIERVENHFFLSLKAVGRLTHQDYKVITPMIDAALAEVKEPNVNVLIDGTELEGWEVSAAWDDLKLGLKHNNEFHKVAIYGNKSWQKVAVKVGGWFMSGEFEFFESLEGAVSWIHQ